MKISDRRLRISDSQKMSDFSNSLGCYSTPKHPQQYAYYHKTPNLSACAATYQKYMTSLDPS